MDALYHYCSTDAFTAIVRTREIWFSSLSLSNDTMEGRLVNRTIMRLAERDNLDVNARERLRDSIAFMEGMLDGLGFALSEDGDLLSQWRGYADDARGVSIGFNRMFLEKFAESSKNKKTPGFDLYKVEYEANTHETKVEPTYRELRRLIDAGAFKIPGIRTLLDNRTEEEVAMEVENIKGVQRALYFKILELFPHLFRLKMPAFKEEREWRLVSILMHDSSDECLYRSTQNRVIPYRVFKLSQSDIPAIEEVVLGPKHETPIHVVESMLIQAGFGKVNVRRSEATYK